MDEVLMRWGGKLIVLGEHKSGDLRRVGQYFLADHFLHEVQDLRRVGQLMKALQPLDSVVDLKIVRFRLQICALAIRYPVHQGSAFF